MFEIRLSDPDTRSLRHHVGVAQEKVFVRASVCVCVCACAHSDSELNVDSDSHSDTDPDIVPVLIQIQIHVHIVIGFEILLDALALVLSKARLASAARDASFVRLR